MRRFGAILALSACTDLGGLSGDEAAKGAGTSLAGDGDFSSQVASCGPDWMGARATLKAVEPGHEGGKACRVCNTTGENGAEIDMQTTRLRDPAVLAGKRLFATAWVKVPDTGINSAYLSFSATRPSGAPVNLRSGSVKSPLPSWELLQITFDVPTDASEVRFSVHAQANVDVCFDVDAVAVTEVK